VRGVIAMILFVNVLEFFVSVDTLILMSLLLFYEVVSVCTDCSCCCGYHLIMFLSAFLKRLAEFARLQKNGKSLIQQ